MTYALEFLLFNMHDQILKWKITIIHLSFQNNVLHIEWLLMNFDLAEGKEGKERKRKKKILINYGVLKWAKDGI